MKRFITSKLFVTLFCTVLLTTNSIAQSFVEYSFTNSPNLISGNLNELNSKYRFANVAIGVDAIVTIVSSTGGATVEILDDNTISKPQGFSPKIIIPNGVEGKVMFSINFVTTNTLTSKICPLLAITAYDIDGNSGLHEIDELDLGAGAVSTFESNNPEIAVTRSGSKFIATNLAGNEYTSIDTAAKQVMYTVKNANVSTFTYAAGANNINNGAVGRQKSIYFKNFLYDNPVTLAVKYTNFSAAVYEKGIQLNWITEFESDNSQFEIERSFDRTNFSTIAYVLDAETVVDKFKTYRFKDNAAILQSKDVVYYRLKQVDNNGKVTYSNTIAVRLKATVGVQIQASPNPFIEKVCLRFTASSKEMAFIKFVNTNGQMVQSASYAVSKGYNNLTITNLQTLPAGAYLVQVIVSNQIIGTQKIIKQ